MAKKRSSREASKAAFLKAMEKSFGNISVSANSAGISRTIVYMWMKDDSEFKEKVGDKEYYEELRLDALEAKLNKVGFIDENPTMLIFLAKTIGKKRGYNERSEIDLTLKELPSIPPVVLNIRK